MPFSRSCIFLFLLGVFQNTYSQGNLVPNPSFEVYSSCPNGAGQVYKAVGWTSYRASPEYFNSCATVSFPEMSVPGNMFGNQGVNQGEAYCGLVSYASSTLFRESIGAQLLSSLTIGQKYFVSMYVSLCDSSGYGALATDKLGIKFSTVPFSFSSPVPINNFAHIKSNSVITDTANWSLVFGSFISDSLYSHIMLGNFYDDANTDTIQIWGPFGNAYYYIDNICVSTDSVYAASWTSVDESSYAADISIFPNPTLGKVIILGTHESVMNIEIFNVLGKKISLQTRVSGNEVEIDLTENPEGIYFLNFHIREKFFSSKILLIK